MTTSAAPIARFTSDNPCPVCKGHNGQQRGQGTRCYGFLSSDERYAHCTRENFANGLPREGRNGADTYAHLLQGKCKCGVEHNPAQHSPGQPSPNGDQGWPSLGPIEKTYDYLDAMGAFTFQVVRFEGKEFRQRRRDDHGEWVWNLDGVTRMLYRLPELLAADPTESVFYVEGEKDVDRLRSLGLVAVTNSGGAGKAGLSDLAPLEGRHLVVLPDNDDKGRAHVQDVAQRAQGAAAASVKIIELPGLPDKGDVSDWLDAGHGPDELLALVASAPEIASEIHSSSGDVPAVERILRSFLTAPELSAMGPATTQWVAEGIAPLGSISEIVGAIKTSGKTTFVLGMCRAIVDGVPFLDRPTKKMPVVYLTEERLASFTAALRRAKLDQCPDFHLLMWAHTIGVEWAETVEAAVQKATELGAILIVDTLPQWAGIRGEGENSAGEALHAMVPLQQAAAAGLAVVLVRHERKSGGEIGESGRGSSAFGGAVDTLLRLKRPDGGSEPNVRVLEGVSRFDGVPPDLYIELTDDGTYAVLGTQADYNKARVREFLLEHAPASEEHAQRVEDITEDSKIGKTTARDVAKELVAQGVFATVGAGKKKDPVRFWMRPSEPQPPAQEIRSSTYRGGVPEESISNPEDRADDIAVRVEDDPEKFIPPQPPPLGAEESISADEARL